MSEAEYSQRSTQLEELQRKEKQLLKDAQRQSVLRTQQETVLALSIEKTAQLEKVPVQTQNQCSVYLGKQQAHKKERERCRKIFESEE